METSERKIPVYALDDFLFQRQLQRSLNTEQERLNALLTEHVRLLQERRALMVKVHSAVQERWKDEDKAASNTHSVTESEGAVDGE